MLRGPEGLLDEIEAPTSEGREEFIEDESSDVDGVYSVGEGSSPRLFRGVLR